MNKAEFLDMLREVMDREEELNEEMLLDDVEEYDSLAALSLMAMFDEYGIDVSPKTFEGLKTIRDLVNLAMRGIIDEG